MKKVFNVDGMTCNSCAGLIERKLEGSVENVSVSYSKSRAEVEFDEAKISEREISDIIKGEGFKVRYNGGVGDKVGFWFMIGSFLVLAYFIYNWILGMGLLIPSVGDQVGIVILFFVGVLTGFHCISMCGAFVVSYTTGNAKKGHSGMSQHFVYGGAKVISYALIGGVFGLIGGVFSFSVGFRAGIAIFAGFFMVMYALSMLSVRFFRRFQINPKFLTRWVVRSTGGTRGFYFSPFMTGILSGLFVACGPLQALYLYAAGTGSFWIGFLSLGAFSLGTLPVLIGFGSLASVISKDATKKILKVAAVLVLILGLIMLNRGLVVLGSNYSFEAISSNFGSYKSEVGSVREGDVQVIRMEVDKYGWNPDRFSLKKGVPVRWEIDVIELTGCNNEIIVEDYDLDVKLVDGMNIVEFVPDEAGTVRWSCWMGMIPGVFVVTGDGQGVEILEESNIRSQALGSCGGSCGESCGGGCGGDCSS